MKNIGRSLRSGIGLALVTAVAVPVQSWAQAGRAKSEGRKFETEIEEITVTAQKREENIQEIPISVTALTAATLGQKSVASLIDLVQTVPNLQFATANAGASTMGIGMRGTVATNPNAFEQNPTVGLYIDGAYFAKMQGSNADLDDLERVEVLRGPQGTLYGRNTIGGAVNLVTRKPTEERSLTAATEVGNYNAFKGRVTLNVPLIGKNGFFQSDALGTLSLRQNAVYKAHDGYWQNKSPTAVKESGPRYLSDLHRVLSMTSLRWQPRNDITIDYAFEYHRFRQAHSAAQLTYVYPGSPVSAGPLDLHPYVRTNRVDSIGNNSLLTNELKTQDRFNDDGNNRMHFLTGTWDVGELGPLGSVTLKSISLYRSFTLDGNTDLDGSPLHITDFHVHGNLDHWSEEVQWIGTAARVRYVLGAYYYGEHSTQINQQVFFGGGSNLYFINTNKNSSYAAFGQATYTPPILSDKLSVTVGLRYTEDHIHTTRNYKNLRIPSLNWVASLGKGFGGTDALSPLGDVAYQWTDNLMTYVRISRGYQSGVSNGQTSDPRLFKAIDPEKLLAYEAGFKSQWFDNRLRVNLDGFFSDYTDRVVNTFRPSPTGGVFSTQENAGKEEIWGSELEVAVIPLRGLEATLNYSYLDPKYTEWESAKFDASGKPIFDENGQPVLEDVADQRDVQLSPAHTVSAGLTYTAPPTSAGVFSARIDTYWQDRVVFHVTRPHRDAGWNYAVVNGRLQFAEIPLAKGSLDVAVFGRNLFDRKYRTWAIDFGSGLGFNINNYGDPRTFGLGLTYHFTAS